MIEFTDEEAVKLHTQNREAIEFLDELVYGAETTDLLYIGANIGKALAKLESANAALEAKVLEAKQTDIALTLSSNGNILTEIIKQDDEQS